MPAISAVCMGNSIVKRLPLPFSLSNRIVPSNISTIRFTIDKPNPKPSCVAALERRSNAPNTRCCSSPLIPLPVSSTTIERTLPLYSIRNDTFPLCVNLTALDKRLPQTCMMRSLSPIRITSSQHSTVKRKSFASAKGINSVNKASAMPCNRNGALFAFSFPLSSRKKSSNVFDMAIILPAACKILSA